MINLEIGLSKFRKDRLFRSSVDEGLNKYTALNVSLRSFASL